MFAESRESFSSLDSEVMEVTAEGGEVMKVTAEGVAKHGDGLDCKVKVEVKSAQNNSTSADKVKEGTKNNAADMFDFSSCSVEWQPGQPVNYEEGMKKEAVNERGGKKMGFANGSTGGEKLDRRKLNKMKMKPFPLSGVQVFKQVMYGIVGIVSNYLQSLETRRSNKVPNWGLGSKWDQSAKMVPKKSQFCLKGLNFAVLRIFGVKSQIPCSVLERLGNNCGSNHPYDDG